MYRTISLACTEAAARRAPSRMRCGREDISRRSFLLWGSPSAPLTMTTADPRAASTRELGADEQVDQGVAALGERTEPAVMRGESLGTDRQVWTGEQPKTAHLASRRSTPAWKEDRAAAGGARDPGSRR